MKIFVTGASGFVGGAAVRALRGEHHIMAMSRSDKSDAAIRALGAEPVRCSLGAVGPEHLSGCAAVVHCAAFVEQWGTRAQFWSANVEGTGQLLQVARQAGVGRFVHIGTEAALFHGQHMRGIDETYPYPASTPYLYSETKAEAERRVLAANAPGFATISLRPRLIWGPGDQTVLPVIAKMVREGRFVWIDGGQARTSTTHIANLVHAIGLALHRGQGGEAYFLSDGHDSTYREFLTALLRTQGLSPSERSSPGAAVRGVAFLVEGAWRLLRLRGEPPLTRFAAAMMSSECTVRIDKARRDLGYAPVISVARGLEELAAGSA